MQYIQHIRGTALYVLYKSTYSLADLNFLYTLHKLKKQLMEENGKTNVATVVKTLTGIISQLNYNVSKAALSL